MNYNNYDFEKNPTRYSSMNRMESELEMSAAFPVLMRKVYLWMTLALVITGFTAYGVASRPGLIQLLLTNSVLFFGLAIAEVGLVMWLSARIDKLSLSSATLMFILYSVLNGAMLSTIFLAYTHSSIVTVFLISAATFASMALIGSITKKDLTSLRKILMMALIGLIIATVVNIFLKSTGLDLILSYVGVLIFVGLTAYDAQKIKQMLASAPDASEHTQKYALLGALTLYLDFINLFIYLLRIFGKRE